MPLYVNDAGTWRQIQSVWVNDSGTWRRIQTVSVNDAGTWRQVHVGDQISLGVTSASRFTTSPTTATATYQLTSAGDIATTSGSSGLADRGDWITPQINMANYESRATLLSGTFSSGTFGAWQSLSTTRSWSMQGVSGAGLVTASMTLEIRRAADAVVMASATISFQAESQV